MVCRRKNKRRTVKGYTRKVGNKTVRVKSYKRRKA